MNNLAQSIDVSSCKGLTSSFKTQRQQQLINLLRNCSQVRPNAKARREILVTTEHINKISAWQVFIQLAIDHRILPLITHNLQRYANEHVPADLMDQLEYQAQRSKLRVFGLTGALVNVLRELQERGVIAVPFKGLILSTEVYGNPALRSFDDIDLWVLPKEFFAVREALASQDYVPYQMSLSTEQDRLYHWDMGEYSLINGESEIGLDVHHRLMAGDCSMAVDFSRCWSRVEETQVMGHAIPTLRREDLMIYLCANGMKDGWSYLRAVCDVAALMTHEVTLDWSFTLHEAKSMKALRMVRVGAMLAHRLLEAPLPSEFSELKPDMTVNRMCDRICNRLSSLERPDAEEQAALEKLILRFLASETLSGRWAYLGRVLSRIFKVATHVTPKDREFVDLPERLHSLYYVIRPIRILYEHQLNLFRVSGYRMFR